MSLERQQGLAPPGDIGRLGDQLVDRGSKARVQGLPVEEIEAKRQLMHRQRIVRRRGRTGERSIQPGDGDIERLQGDHQQPWITGSPQQRRGQRQRCDASQLQVPETNAGTIEAHDPPEQKSQLFKNIGKAI